MILNTMLSNVTVTMIRRQPLNDKASIKYLTNGEFVDIELEHYDENGNVIDYMKYVFFYYYCMDYSKYDLSKTTKQIRTKNFICEAPIGSGKSTAIHKWISSHKDNKFKVIVLTVNISEEFYTSLIMNLTFHYVLTITRLVNFVKL